MKKIILFNLFCLSLIISSAHSAQNKDLDAPSHVSDSSLSAEDRALKAANPNYEPKAKKKVSHSNNKKNKEVIIVRNDGTHVEKVETVDLTQSADKNLQCEMNFELRSWAFLFKAGGGSGVIVCENGMEVPVRIKVRGGGLSFGRLRIADGSGTFSKVRDLSDLFGNYISAGANAGAGKSSSKKILRKGKKEDKVTLSLSGKGKGVNAGVALASFKILPVEGGNDTQYTQR